MKKKSIRRIAMPFAISVILCLAILCGCSRGKEVKLSVTAGDLTSGLKQTEYPDQNDPKYENEDGTFNDEACIKDCDAADAENTGTILTKFDYHLVLDVDYTK